MCFNLWRNLDVVQVYDRSCNNSGYPYFPQWARVCADRIANICNQTKDCRAILLSSGSLRSTLHWFCLKKVAKHDIDPFYHLRLAAIYTTLWLASVRFTPLPTQHVQAHCGLHTHIQTRPGLQLFQWNFETGSWRHLTSQFLPGIWAICSKTKIPSSCIPAFSFFHIARVENVRDGQNIVVENCFNFSFSKGWPRVGHLAGRQNDDMGYTEGAVCWQRSNN